MAMPDMDGLEVCRHLRRDPALAAIPILFLTVRSSVDDRVSALDEGGDDYLVKPFDLRELKSRLRALLRRSQPAPRPATEPESTTYQVNAGLLTLDLHRRQVRVGSRTASLTPSEFDLLHFLMLHPDEVFSSERLFEAVWGYAHGVAGAGPVRWHIRNLRAKLESDPVHPTFLRTVPRHGYILCTSPTQS
jgi:DNA-binding response OmpR family regulator